MDEKAIREHFTELGCVMEDASAVALIWRNVENMSLAERHNYLLQASRKISNLLGITGEQASELDTPVSPLILKESE